VTGAFLPSRRPFKHHGEARRIAKHLTPVSSSDREIAGFRRVAPVLDQGAGQCASIVARRVSCWRVSS
jgi:hypothetical protein